MIMKMECHRGGGSLGMHCILGSNENVLAHSAVTIELVGIDTISQNQMGVCPSVVNISIQANNDL